MKQREHRMRDDEAYARQLQIAEESSEDEVNILIIDTQISEEDIKVMDFTPETEEEQEIYKYN